jgi:soluble P-type ATPase
MGAYKVRGYRFQRRWRTGRLVRFLLARGKVLAAAPAGRRWLRTWSRSQDLFEIRSVVLDLNGTTAVYGQQIPGLRELVDSLSAAGLKVYLLTGDIRGNAKKMFAGWPVEVIGLVSDRPSEEKRQWIERLGPDQTAMIGNGANDFLALLTAVWSGCVMQEEGCSPLSVANSVLLFSSFSNAVKALLDPKVIDAGGHL